MASIFQAILKKLDVRDNLILHEDEINEEVKQLCYSDQLAVCMFLFGQHLQMWQIWNDCLSVGEFQRGIKFLDPYNIDFTEIIEDYQLDPKKVYVMTKYAFEHGEQVNLVILHHQGGLKLDQIVGLLVKYQEVYTYREICMSKLMDQYQMDVYLAEHGYDIEKIINHRVGRARTHDPIIAHAVRALNASHDARLREIRQRKLDKVDKMVCLVLLMQWYLLRAKKNPDYPAFKRMLSDSGREFFSWIEQMARVPSYAKRVVFGYF